MTFALRLHVPAAVSPESPSDMTGASTLDLHEQGIETRLDFAVTGDQVRIERRDLFGRPVQGFVDELPRGAVIEPIRTLARTFVDAAQRRSPARCAHPWFAAWAQSLLAAASEWPR
jgi:hypothetical protein